MAADRFRVLGADVVLGLGGWQVLVLERVAVGDETRVFVDQEAQQIIMAGSAWATLGFDGDAMDQFLDGARELSGAFDLSRTDYWAQAVRAHYQHVERLHLTPTGDRIADVSGRVESFLHEAASINSTATDPATMSVFTQRYAEMQADVERLQAELRAVEGKLLMAREAVMGALL